MPPRKHTPIIHTKDTVYKITIDCEYYTFSNSGRDKDRVLTTVTLPSAAKSHGYLYACKKTLEKRLKKLKRDFRRVRTLSIVGAEDINNPGAEITDMDLMSWDQLIDHCRSNYPDIDTGLYYNEDMKGDLKQAILEYEAEPVAALKMQKWKLDNSNVKNRKDLFAIINEFNPEEEDAL